MALVRTDQLWAHGAVAPSQIIYTCPADSRVLIKSIVTHNNEIASAADFTYVFRPAGGVVGRFSIWRTPQIAAGQVNTHGPGLCYIVLEPTDAIEANPASGNMRTMGCGIRLILP